MAAKTVVIQKRQPVTENFSKDFSFTPAMMPPRRKVRHFSESTVPGPGKRIKIFQCPAITDEAWRRTDLKDMRAGKFRLVEMDGRKSEFIEPGAELLQPLAGDRHGGQIILLPGETRIELDPVAICKGCDLYRFENR